MDPEELKLKAARECRGAVVQTAAQDAATNELFVEMLAAQTLQAQTTGSLLARNPEMDFLLRLAGTAQISKAIGEKGSAVGKPFLLVVASRRRLKELSGLTGLELPRRGLSKSELLRVERAALLSAERA